ncbi:hypothetical protein NDA07_14955 [Microcoleus vaginatus DQ-U2]|uniref:hypothetical protein n=1 Tax=Microcoleus vaginatus TaxID=119532 RepID=UPI0018EF59FC
MTNSMLSRVMMKANPVGAVPPCPPSGELPMYHSMMAVLVSRVCWNLMMSIGSTF